MFENNPSVNSDNYCVSQSNKITNKRNHSSGDSPILKKNKPLFATSNRYSCFPVDDDENNTLEHVQTDQTPINEELKTPPPPPIIVNGTNDFICFQSNLINWLR